MLHLWYIAVIIVDARSVTGLCQLETVFEGSHLSVWMVLHLILIDNTTSYRTSKLDTELSNETVNDWLMYLREVQLEALVHSSQSKIGGANCTVEVDESKFGKRKYNRRRVVEGQWVVGGICKETREIFVALYPDNKSDSATLISITEQHDCGPTFDSYH